MRLGHAGAAKADRCAGLAVALDVDRGARHAERCADARLGKVELHAWKQLDRLAKPEAQFHPLAPDGGVSSIRYGLPYFVARTPAFHRCASPAR